MRLQATARPLAGDHLLTKLLAEQTRRLTGQKLLPPNTVLRKDFAKRWPPDYGRVYAWREMTLAKVREGEIKAEDLWEYYKHNKVDFINHWCDTFDPRNSNVGKPTRMPLVLFQKQDEAIQFVTACRAAQGRGLIEKSRDMGATWVCIGDSVHEWIFVSGSATGWGSNNADQVDKIGDPGTIFEKIRMMIRQLPSPLFVPAEVFQGENLKQQTCINPVNGSIIKGQIGPNIGRGDRTGTYYVDEAGHLEYPQLVEASLSDTTRVRIDISSVSPPGTIFHRTRVSGVDWRVGKPALAHEVNVFVMDWSDHPEKSKEWHDLRKANFKKRGLGSVFAREVERDYYSANDGQIINPDHVEASFDADKVLRKKWPEVYGDVDFEAGPWRGGLDVADQGIDTNAIILGKGAMVKYAEEWGEKDPGATARRAITACRDVAKCTRDNPCTLQYDCIGLGTNVKSMINLMEQTNSIPPGFRAIPWHAGAAVLNPYDRIIDDDKDSPIMKDYYFNFKAQGWGMTARYFANTFLAVEEGVLFPVDELIILPRSLPLLLKIKQELCQAVAKPGPKLKMLVDKLGEGDKSPNLGDSMVQFCWPWQGLPSPSVSMFGPKIIRSDE